VPMDSQTMYTVRDSLRSLDPATRLVTAEAIRTHVVGPMADEAVAQLRAEGRTWEQVGAVLGVTKQAAQKRWGASA
jgi:hypothetical protein